MVGRRGAHDCPLARRQFVRGAVDIRTQLNGALHRLRTGCLWDELPECHGPWQLAKERQNTWFRKGLGAAGIRLGTSVFWRA
ncbi:transposase [Streptomyces sp. NPDC056405]|uniref:transposase n=1 Tax=Streptomyces sp. NPDC056405 TaxID=3345811 RepID=UPI0035D7FB1D